MLSTKWAKGAQTIRFSKTVAANRIFLSSTSLDLAEHRAAVARALRGAGYEPIGMEDFGAQPIEPLRASLTEVARADLFIGIYAGRYGYVPPFSEFSVTEQELHEARRLGRPCFCFLVEEGFAWPEEHREAGEGGIRLTRLKEQIRRDLTFARFTTPDHLANVVLASLSRWERGDLAVPATRERGDELRLAEAVERTWIGGVLLPSVPPGRELPVGWRERQDLVRPPGPRERSEAAGSREGGTTLIGDRALLDLLLTRGGQLLILGAPGSGKTTALLQVTRGLLALARRDSHHQVPVVLNLASWGRRGRGDLASWIVEEVAVVYQAGRAAARQWLADHRLLPILDGLDEVAAESRQACAAAIDAFLGEHGLWGLVVASRTREYTVLRPLPLRGAIELEPLSSDQVVGHFAASSVAADLAEDPGLRELASSPLFLSLLEKTSRAAGASAFASTTAMTSADLRQRVLSAYVTAMLGDSPEGSRFSTERLRCTLSWLASRMRERGASLFQVEGLQPSWLATRGQLWAYALLSRCIGGLLLLVSGWSTGFPLAFGAAAGLFVGLLDVRNLARTTPQERRRPWRHLLLAVVGLLACYVGTSVLWYGTWNGTRLVMPAVLNAILFTGLLARRGARRDGDCDIQPTEELVWLGLSRRGALVGAVLPVATASIFLQLALKGRSWDSVEVLLVVIFGIFGGLVGGVLGGIGARPIPAKTLPNQGIWRTLRNATLLALGTALIIMALGVLASLLAASITTSELLQTTTAGMSTFGVWVALAFGGLDVLQHFVLRLLLALRSPLPFLFPRILDHAVERELLRRAGGSYLFLHPLLLDHFASQPFGGAGEAGKSSLVQEGFGSCAGEHSAKVSEGDPGDLLLGMLPPRHSLCCSLTPRTSERT